MDTIGTELIDEEQQVHVTLHETTAEAPGCPADYVWSSTGELRIKVVQMTGGRPRREQDFLELRLEEILFAAGVNLKLEHAFYQMRERVQRLSKDQRLICSDIRALGNTDKPDNSLHTRYLMFS